MATVGIVGMGLIGASLAKRLQSAGQGEVVCFDIDPSTRVAATQAGLDAVESLEVLVAQPLDVLVVATPMPAFDPLFREIARLGVGRDFVVTDTGSVKRPVLDLARTAFGLSPSHVAGPGSFAGPRYLGGHPMAGTQESGFGASTPALFDASVWVLGVEDDTDRRDFVAVAQLLTAIGIEVMPLTADAHYTAVAAVSHLPHVVAAGLSILAGTSGWRCSSRSR